MPVIGNNGRALLNGLSDFWLKYFADLGDIEATYEGAQVLFGQTYLNMLSDVLNTSVIETPLFKTEYYKLLTVREDQVVFFDSGEPGVAWFVAGTAATYGALPVLQNKVFAPTAALEQNLDYTLAPQQIRFNQDPTNTPPAGFAQRTVDVAITGTFSATGADWIALGVQKGDVLYTSSFSQPVGDGTDAGHTIANVVVKVTADKLYLRAGGTLPTTLGGQFWVVGRRMIGGAMLSSPPVSVSASGTFVATQSMPAVEVAFWAVDAQVDDMRLYTVYGHYFSEPRASSEAYRAFIRGIMQLYVMGPVIDRMESALNVMAALPVIRDDGEVLLSYDDGIADEGVDGAPTGNIFTAASANFTDTDIGAYLEIVEAANASNVGVFRVVGVLSATSVVLNNTTAFVAETNVRWQLSTTDEQTVVTSRDTYTYPRRIPMRADVLDTGNWGGLTFNAFEAVTLATVVTDYVRDPEWWVGLTLPSAVMPSATPAQRVASAQLLPNIVGPIGAARVGDPGFYIGVGEDGEPGTTYRHSAAFILMDRFLKTHMIRVRLDPHLDLSGSLHGEMFSLLQEVRPAHTLLYIQPLSTFVDTIAISETTLDTQMVWRPTPDEFRVEANNYAVGSGWLIGDTWEYASASGDTITINGGNGISVVIGGADPSIAPTHPSTEAVAYYIDRPLHVTVVP